MQDLFAREQEIADAAFARIKNGSPCTVEDYTELAKEYRRLLKQVRIVTRISDKTTIDLNTRKLDLQGKVLFDQLTGIYNRRFLDESMARILLALAPGRGMLGVLMVDVDFFKQYNDTYGHEKGDECLQLVAKTISQSMQRKDDFAARYGGEEFVVVLPGADSSSAQSIACRILENIRKCDITHKTSSAAHCVTVSVGVTAGIVEAFCTPEDFIRIADMALYRSKKNGRNQCTYVKMEEEI